MGAITEPKVYRLRDILTKEVSLVDRAANKRKFLLRKNDEGRPVVSDGKGGFIAVAPGENEETAQPDPKPAETPAPVDPAKPAETPAPAPAPAQPPAPVDPNAPVEVTEKTYAALVKAVENLSALAKSVKPVATLTLDSKVIAEKVGAALDGVEFSAERDVPVYWEDGWKCSAQALAKQLKTASAKLAEVASDLAVETGDNPPPHELRWRIVDVLDNLVEYTRFEVAQRAMEKRAPETVQFEAIVKGLSVVLGAELEDKVDADQAVKLVAAAEEVIKAQSARIKKQHARIQALESEPQLSHRIPVAEQKLEVRKTNEVAWPRDMNEKTYDEDLSFA